MRTNRGVTIVDVLVLTVIGLMAGVVVLPRMAAQTREQDNRIKCASNMRQICLAMKMYANEEARTQAYPRTVYNVKTADKPVWYTRPEAANPYAKGGPDANDVTAAMYMLLRTQEITTDVFVCPSAGTTRFIIPAGMTPLQFSNFKSAAVLSYSMQNPYATKAGVQNGFAFNDAISADFAILADMSPGGEPVVALKRSDVAELQREGNSPNHGFDGQNVCYADGHVDWATSVWAGCQQDNIYTYRSAVDDKANKGPAEIASLGTAGPPADSEDTVMLPTWDDKIPFPTIDLTAPGVEPKRR